jgi:hypothetical protein
VSSSAGRQQTAASDQDTAGRVKRHSPNWGGARTAAGRPRSQQWQLPPTDIRALDMQKVGDRTAAVLLSTIETNRAGTLGEIAASLNDQQLDQLLLQYGVAGGGIVLPSRPQ